MHLRWHDYRYYPYERELAYREIAVLFGNPSFTEVIDGLELDTDLDYRLVNRLTYFSEAWNGEKKISTAQGRLENAARRGKSRQATRYSVHGMHEYKGKFNPQVVRALLNFFKIHPGQRVLDPYCGSGTTLVECSHIGVSSLGVDLNPFAVFLANAKLQALATPASHLWRMLKKFDAALERKIIKRIAIEENSRSQYLRSWFQQDILRTIEFIRAEILNTCGELSPVFLVIASNLLRDYSLQDPTDLRIRRRKSQLPEVSFSDSFIEACRECIERIEATQEILGAELPVGEALLIDTTTLELENKFDAAITSPPYAMALPYIDTQRLSIVWLGLSEPENIAELEADLIGSREIRGKARHRIAETLYENKLNLPAAQAKFCVDLSEKISDGDGFRRQAVPVLLYRYLASMLSSFRAIRKNMFPQAPFALIVGHNHTVLGGVRYEINTPEHLVALALESGWKLEETISLQTYQRYGYHKNNSVSSESLVVLRNS